MFLLRTEQLQHTHTVSCENCFVKKRKAKSQKKRSSGDDEETQNATLFEARRPKVWVLEFGRGWTAKQNEIPKKHCTISHRYGNDTTPMTCRRISERISKKKEIATQELTFPSRRSKVWVLEFGMDWTRRKAKTTKQCTISLLRYVRHGRMWVEKARALAVQDGV
jgi:hypothetical protein